MGDINYINDLRILHDILDRELHNTRLERAENIPYVPLYRENRIERDGYEEEIFNPLRHAPLNGPRGFWCFTRLFYDEHGTAIRRVPVGVRGWKIIGTDTKDLGDGRRWCIRKLKYNSQLRFRMTQYTLGGRDEQPEYAICQIFGLNQGDAGNPRLPPEQPPQGPQGGGAGENNDDTTQGPPNYAPTNLPAVEPAAPEPPRNLVRRRKLDVRDMFDGSAWTIENPAVIELLKMFKSAPDQSTREIRELNAASAPDCSNTSTMHQNSELPSSIIPTQKGLHPSYQDYQGSVDPGTIFHSGVQQGPQPNNIQFESNSASTYMGTENGQSTVQLEASEEYPHEYNQGHETIVNSDQVEFNGMANQWDAILRHLGESTTSSNLGFSDDFFHTSGPN